MPTQTYAVEKVSTSELLDRYAANQDKLKSLIVKTEERFISKWSHEPGPNFVRWITELRTDGERIYLKMRIWDDLDADDAPTPIAGDQQYVEIWNGKLYINCYDVPTEIPKEYLKRVRVSTTERHKRSTYFTYTGVPFLGIRYGGYERIDAVLRQADCVAVRDKLEHVGSASCYVIDAKTKSGDYTVWIDPKHGYNIVKADIHVGPNDSFGRRTFGDQDSESLSIRNIRFEKISGAWIPMEADLYNTSNRKGRPSVRNTIHHTINQITLDPDHEALDSFTPEIENGTEIRDLDSRARYRWQEGMKFVVDKWDNSVKYVPKNWSILVGVGKPLPKFEGIKLNFSAEHTKDRAILLCFFDMNQRPSRNCVIQLAQKAAELKEKGVAVAAVQTSQVNENTLNEWIKKNNISFPVGAIISDIEKARFAWGVRALPWLILTDPNHFVTAEGFTLDELYDKVRVVERPSVSDLLDRYAANQDKLKSFVVKTESVSTHLIQQDDSTQRERKRRYMVEFRYEDSGSGPAVYYGWKEFDLGDDGIWVPEDRDSSFLWDGKLNYEYHRAPVLDSSNVHIIKGYEYARHGIGVMYLGACPILGILYGDVERFDSILRQSETISVRSKLERIGSVDCHVIDAKSSTHGTYTVWLDPEHGYGIARAVAHKGPEDFQYGRPPSSYIGSGSRKGRSFFLENVRFENIEGIWIPVEANTRTVIERVDSTSSGRYHFKITQIDIDPNHTELRSFVPDIENGTDVSIFRGPEYKWQEGMKFVVDEWDGGIRYVPKEWSILIGVGKPLPNFEGIKLKLSDEQTKDRAILLCFFDMNQRPSRYCVKQLTQKSAALKEKGITVAAVQTSQVTNNTLNEWAKTNNIPFPVGAITADIEKTRFAWGVRSLPWLILSDNQHIVTAEGFAPAELDEKLGKNSKH